MKSKILLTILLCNIAFSCGKTKTEKQKEESDNALLLGIILLAANPAVTCTTIGTSTTTTNSDSTIKNVSIPATTTMLCSSQCLSSFTCAMQLTFATAGTYSITLTQAKETRKCGSTTHTQVIDTSYGAFTSNPYTLTSPTSTTTASPSTINETLTAGAIRGVSGTLTSVYASGTCSGSFSYSGTTSYTVLITKTN